MGLFDFVKKQFIDVIEWTEPGNGILAYRYPMQDNEIQYGAQLTVRESQLAMFVNEGQIADVLTPGRHKLITQTIPLLTNLKNWDKLFQSPFKSDVYFFSTRLQTDQKWGTSNPITLRDKEFGAIRMRAFGIYSYRLTDARRFYTEISGTRDTYTVEELDGQLRNSIVGSITDLFAESGIPFLDLAANQDELSKRIKDKLADSFSRFGLTLDSFVVQNISLPEELQKILDQRIGINIAGDLNKLTQYQVAQSIPTAAANEGGVAGAGAGFGAGMAMGQAMLNSLNNSGGGNAASTEDVTVTIQKLHDLMTKGVLTQAEFDAKKAELLKKIT